MLIAFSKIIEIMFAVQRQVNFLKLVVSFAIVLLSCMLECYGREQFKDNSISRYYRYRYGLSGCEEPDFSVRERNALAIFSGTIRDLEPGEENPDVLKATVEVKRVIKGVIVLNRIPRSPDDVRKLVVVEGIGDTKICRSFARKRDTRIFLVGKGVNGELKLNSSLERITLENIKTIEIAVKNDKIVLPPVIPSLKPNNASTSTRSREGSTSIGTGIEVNDTVKYDVDLVNSSSRKPSESRTSGHSTSPTNPTSPTAPSSSATALADPCANHSCLFGAECSSDPVTGGATCACSDKCSPLQSQVCGSDGVTYDSECHLRMESCTRQTDIKVQDHRPCVELRDPCEDKECSFGARCVASLDGLTARCQCQEKCDDFGDSVGSYPVCGSDGQDYANMCELTKKACEEMRDFEKKFSGKCDPCHGMNCPFGQMCQLDSARRPVCRCGETCPMIFDPVCGSDGKTYANECLMREDACKRLADTRVLFHGECSSGVNPCSEKICGLGEHCYVDSSFVAHCLCPPECPSYLRPICGSDGRTYDSECHLKRQSCLDKSDVTIRRHGNCDESGPCSNYKCENGGHCVLHNGLPICACPSCSEEYEPVCGSDNFSYPNECKLQLENCKTSKMTTVRYRGRCLADICSQTKCDFYAVCEIDDKGSSQCVCPNNCEEVMAVVCGSDGVTYTNECELQHASCTEQKAISIISNGSCDPCDGVACEYGGVCKLGSCICSDDCPTVTDEPVCADNSVTYPSECALRKASCEQKTAIDVVHVGSCDETSGSGDSEAVDCNDENCKFDGICTPNGNGTFRCVCSFNCDALRSPVCGSDGKTYGNECHLKEEACNKQVAIQTQPMENCEDIDEELCDGAPALVNPLTGREYNCNRGKDTCPAGSYCHKLGTIARCCKEDKLAENCASSKFGCCVDGITSAPGPNSTGCPNVCQCNSLGSLSTTCDPVTRQCTCRPGVGGVKCDRCLPHFWGLPKIAEGNNGCLPCGCNVHGSMRDDCEQMTGRCMCRPGITGQRCNVCPNGKYLGPTGCSDVMLNDENIPESSTASFRSCSDNVCLFGAVCRISNGQPECVCQPSCPTSLHALETNVCGSDGKTYPSICKMTAVACQTQKNITVVQQGSCDARVVVPSFSGNSYLQLKKFSQGSQDMKIEINFQPQREDGILLYAAQSLEGTSGDFISVAITNGFVEFRYDLGSGQASMKSLDRIKLGMFHRVIASRSGQSGSLTLDNATEVIGSSLGRLQSLNLYSPVYLGNAPGPNERLMNRIGVTVGFIGCVESLIVSSSQQTIQYDLNSNRSADVEKQVDVGACGMSLCSSFPCINGGICLETDDGANFQCSCLDGFSGSFCENRVIESPCVTDSPCGIGGICQSLADNGFKCDCFPEYEGERCDKVRTTNESKSHAERAVAFDGLSYYQLRNSVVKKSEVSNRFELRFRTDSLSGLLLLTHKSDSIESDYLAIAINRGHVQVSFNLGKESPTDILFLTSPVDIADSEWHTLVFSRIKRQAHLFIDGEHPTVSAVASAGTTHLDTDGHLWIGGSKRKVHGLPEAYYASFHGCIQYLKINEHTVDLVKDGEIHGAVSYCDA